MRRHLAPKGVKVHNLSFTDANPVHIDASLLLVKPGLAITNPERPCHQAEIFEKSGWDVKTIEHPTSAPAGSVILKDIIQSYNPKMFVNGIDIIIVSKVTHYPSYILSIND